MSNKPRQGSSGGHGKRHFLVASDFDKTLSFNDSGLELAELLGVKDFEARVERVSRQNLVQQGGELAFLLRHDPAFASVRRNHLIEAGKRVKLKKHIRLLLTLLTRGIDELGFSFYVISAAPEEVIRSALEGIVPPENIIGTRFGYNQSTGAIEELLQVAAGYGKVAVLTELQQRLKVSDERVIYSGDGQSDIHVMLHINQRKGYTIAVSQAQVVTSIARRTVLSDDAVSVLVPVLEDICLWEAPRIRAFFESQDLVIQEWAKMRTDVLTIHTARGAPSSDEADR
jgi:2-hydroxy-3-keto-5-methylthiopentenyl-1-phosphate phosphatase